MSNSDKEEQDQNSCSKNARGQSMSDSKRNSSSKSEGSADVKSISSKECREKVGYKNPPVATRFKPGQSGNPRGRPKGRVNVETERKCLRAAIQEALNEDMPARINGKSTLIPTRKIIAKSLVRNAALGNAKAINQLLDFDEQEPACAENPIEHTFERVVVFPDGTRTERPTYASRLRERESKAEAETKTKSSETDEPTDNRGEPERPQWMKDLLGR